MLIKELTVKTDVIDTNIDYAFDNGDSTYMASTPFACGLACVLGVISKRTRNFDFWLGPTGFVKKRKNYITVYDNSNAPLYSALSSSDKEGKLLIPLKTNEDLARAVFESFFIIK